MVSRIVMLRRVVAVVLVGGPLVLAAAPVGAQRAPGVQPLALRIPLPSLAPLVDAVAPAVVNISVVMAPQEIAQDEEGDGLRPGMPGGPGLNDFLRRFFDRQALPMPGPGGRRATALGSGFLIGADGYVVTNNHVVGSAETVTVILQDNSKYPARIVGRDEATDVALVKIDAGRPLPFLAWGDSDTAKVGDWVIAVGNPFGLGGTVTSGIVSARGRNIDAGPYDDFLQIDASINRGNSGGPTFDLSGQVIGINTAIYSPSGGSVGIGFAVPANLAKTVVAQLQEHGKVSRGWLGAHIQPLTPEIAKGLGLPATAHGAVVADVVPGSPAAQAGLNPGDVIARYDGREIKSAHDLPRYVAETPVGQTAELTVLRNGREEPVRATIAALERQGRRAADSARSSGSAGQAPSASQALGLRLAPLTDELRRQAGVPRDVEGVIVTDVADDSPAADLVKPGDVIVSVNRQPTTDPGRAADQLRQAATSKQALLVLNRQGANRFVGVPLGDSRG